MDAFKALAAQQGCSADGTTATRNPMSQFVEQMMKPAAGMQHGPRGAPMQGAQHANEMDAAFAQGMNMQAPRGPMIGGPMQHQQMAAAYAAEFEQMQRQGGPVMMGPRMQGPRPMGPDAWVNDFERMKLGPQAGGMSAAQIHMEAAYRNSFQPGPQARAMGQRWGAQMAARPPPSQMDRAWQRTAAPPPTAQGWAEEMAGPKEAPDAEKWAQEAAKQAEAPSAENLEAAWAENASEENVMNKMESMFQKAWQDSQDGKEVDFESIYKTAMEEAGATGLEGAWADSREDDLGFGSAWSETQTANLADRPYELAAENKFNGVDNPFERGMELFKQGQLPDAILAFEAAISVDQTHSEAWRMLGVAHQENDQDPKAIACLERAVENDAYNLDALLGLGVSYVNELDQERALKNLKAWVVNNPHFAGLEVSQDLYGDGSLMDDVMQLMLKAAEYAPKDPEVHQVLGVLYNVSREYNAAAQAFKTALSARPDDYSLWNRLGATLANGQRSEDALPSYHRALELKPRYARGWLNLGISHSNLAQYHEAARCYLKALDLNPEAVHIWSYLRICFTCMERFDLIALCDKRNIDAFRGEFKF